MPQFVSTQITVGSSTATATPASTRQNASLQEMAHEIRQPLSVIENIAYYLEMTTSDEAVAGQLRRIQAMVMQAHGLLRTACEAC